MAKATSIEVTNIVVTFDMDRETKNTIRFVEVVPDGSQHVMGKVYVQKADLEKIGSPKTITVMIQAKK